MKHENSREKFDNSLTEYPGTLAFVRLPLGAMISKASGNPDILDVWG
jgi:hypothetical protein